LHISWFYPPSFTSPIYPAFHTNLTPKDGEVGVQFFCPSNLLAGAERAEL
jgi:hypothetical protein